ncbi:Prestalk A differentiation protein A [Hondaea fermentalgiana]|uniref:Prestalk A differentiation protein A n=1 Tax=Hondaea fermentalgiana TaxID=2315210 RepID=A0A2R5GC06_9STRA|nr:Prestalk A differentiation protein A [Hondaea fermentalgiana]|eukprot:GBG26113.1 Prestalk A differentiation protein A [Hondaea fermentalgiana]
MGCGPSSSLKADAEAHAHALREAEAALERAHETIMEQDRRLQELEKELETIRAPQTTVNVKNVLILGSTGHIGKATVKALTTRAPKTRIFTGTRNTSHANDAGFAGLGENVVPIRVDPANKDEVAKVIIENEVEAVFLIIPGSEKRTEISISAIQGCRLAKVPGLVLLSVPSVAAPETIFAKQLIPVEAAARESGVPTAILRVPLFTDNCFAYMGSIRGEGKIYGPAEPDTTFSTVVTSDVGEAAAVVLCNIAAHKGATYELASDTYSHADVAKSFSKALGTQIEYVQVSVDAAKESFLHMGFPEWQTKGLLELYSLIDEKRPCMTIPKEQLEQLTGKEATSMTDFVQAVAPLFRSSEGPEQDVAAPESPAIESNSGSTPLSSSTSGVYDPQGPILLLNSTSDTGRATARAIVAAGFPVIAGMRDASSVPDALDVEGITPVKVDLGNADEVASVILEHHPSALFIIAPPAEDRARICLNAIKGIKSVHFTGIVLALSVINMDLPSTPSSLATDFTPLECSLKESSLKHCILRLPFFFDNLLAFRHEIATKSRIRAPLAADIPFAAVALNDVGAAAAKILTHPKNHIGEVYTLVSDVFTYEDVALALTDTLGKTVAFHEVPWQETKEELKAAGFADWFVNEILENYKILNEGGEDREIMSRKNEHLQDITGSMPTSLKAYLSSVSDRFKE